jgi:hypothetical protein
LRLANPGGTIKGVQATTDAKGSLVTTHLTPSELARELGLARREVIGLCIERSIPILNGRVDRALVQAELAANPVPELAGRTPRPAA